MKHRGFLHQRSQSSRTKLDRAAAVAFVCVAAAVVAAATVAATVAVVAAATNLVDRRRSKF